MALFRTNHISKISSTLISRNLTFQTGGGQEPQVRQKINFEDKVAVVTGGASGIGYSLAKNLLNKGLSAVAIIDSDKKKLDEASNTIIRDYGEEKILAIEADVADIEQMDTAFRNVVLYYHVINIIVNNAGIMDDSQWEKQLKTNLNGCVIGTLLGMQYMAKSSHGSGGTIVNIGSIMSIIPSCGFPIYTMSQFGIAGFSKALGSSKLYERTGVKIFGYCPGLTNTKMLEDISPKCINMNFAVEFQVEIENCRKQSADYAAQGLVNILDDAKPGSLWVVENGNEPYEVELKAGVKKKVEKVEERMANM